MSTITRIDTFRVPPRWLFVRVETADGAVGWGEASLEGHAEAVEGAFAALRDRFLGSDDARIEDIWQTAYRLGFYRGGPVLMSALSGKAGASARCRWVPPNWACRPARAICCATCGSMTSTTAMAIST